MRVRAYGGTSMFRFVSFHSPRCPEKIAPPPLSRENRLHSLSPLSRENGLHSPCGRDDRLHPLPLSRENRLHSPRCQRKSVTLPLSEKMSYTLPVDERKSVTLSPLSAKIGYTPPVARENGLNSPR